MTEDLRRPISTLHRLEVQPRLSANLVTSDSLESELPVYSKPRSMVMPHIPTGLGSDLCLEI